MTCRCWQLRTAGRTAWRPSFPSGDWAGRPAMGFPGAARPLLRLAHVHRLGWSRQAEIVIIRTGKSVPGMGSTSSRIAPHTVPVTRHCNEASDHSFQRTALPWCARNAADWLDPGCASRHPCRHGGDGRLHGCFRLCRSRRAENGSRRSRALSLRSARNPGHSKGSSTSTADDERAS